MPVVLRVEGWAIRIYTDEHAPPHVHARFSGGEVKVLLPPPGEPVAVLKVRRLTTRDAIRGVRIVEDNLPLLRACWSEIHG